MKNLQRKLLNASIAILTLPITIIGNTPQQIRAEESKGIYVTGSYGTSSFTSADWKATVNDLAHKGDLKFNDGSGWETGLGYDFGRLRTEISYGSSINEIKSISATIDEGILKGTAAQSSASGDLIIKNILINGYLDFPIGEENKLTPYLGAGIGGSKLSIDNITVDSEELEAAVEQLAVLDVQAHHLAGGRRAGAIAEPAACPERRRQAHAVCASATAMSWRRPAQLWCHM